MGNKRVFVWFVFVFYLFSMLYFVDSLSEEYHSEDLGEGNINYINYDASEVRQIYENNKTINAEKNAIKVINSQNIDTNVNNVNENINEKGIEGSYIIEFRGEPLSKRIDKKKGSEIYAVDINENINEILEEHKLALENINSEYANFSPPKENFLLKIPLIDFLINILFPKLTGNSVKVFDEGIIVPSSEYYNTFNGISVYNLDEEEVEKIKSSPYVKNVYENRKVNTLLTDSVRTISADKVWEYDSSLDLCNESGQKCLTGEGIKVAVIDTGVDYTNPILGGCLGQGCKIAGGYNIVKNNNDPMDDHGHGTHVTGIIAGNGIVKGVAPNVTIYSYKVLDQYGYGSWDWVLEGIERAVDPNKDGKYDDKADIISMSLGGLGNSDDVISRAIDNAVEIGIVSVIAAGNSGPNGDSNSRTRLDGYESIGSPGTARKAITVGASMNNYFRNSSLYINGEKIDSLALDRSAATKNLEGVLEIAPNCSNMTKYVEYIFDEVKHKDLIGKVVFIPLCNFQDSVIINSKNWGAKAVILYPDMYDYLFYSRMLHFATDIPVLRVSDESAQYLISKYKNIDAKVNMTVEKEENFNDSVAGFSSLGPVIWDNGSIIKPDVIAPGVNIISTFYDIYDGAILSELSGTSMATPHVAGVVALMKQKNPDWSPEEIKTVLRTTADNIGENISIIAQGYGRVNALKAINAQRPEKVEIYSNGKVKTIFDITGAVSKTADISNISLYYGAGTDPKEWKEIPLGISNVKEGFLNVTFNSMNILDGMYSLRLRVYGANNYSEDRSLIIVNNIELSGVEPYEVYNHMENFNILIKSNIYEGSFKNYSLEYSLMENGTTLNNWKTIGLEICNPTGKELINYKRADIKNCKNKDFLKQEFIWNATELTKSGMYSLRLRVINENFEDNESLPFIYISKEMKKGWPVHLNYEEGNFIGYLNPAVYDINNDGYKEIIINYGRNGFGSYSTLVALYQNGSLYWATDLDVGVDKDYPDGTSVHHVPIVEDINNDGYMEILLEQMDFSGADDSGYPTINKIYALNYKGEILNGWPINVSQNYLPRMISGDLDRDGTAEIIIQNNFYDNPHMGLIDINDNVTLEWRLPPSYYGNPFYSPAIGNLDDDGDLEIAIIESAGKDYRYSTTDSQPLLFVFNKDGTINPEFPINIEGSLAWNTGPSIGDVNGDGKDEIVISMTSQNLGRIKVYYQNGTIDKNFDFFIPISDLPAPYNISKMPMGGITLSDVNGDGKDEIIFGAGNTMTQKFDIYVLNSTGGILNGWPKKVPLMGSLNLYESFGPTVADVDGDGGLDIVISGGSAFPLILFNKIWSNEGGIWAWHVNGSQINGFPYGTQYYTSAQPVVSDIDEDSKEEIIGSAYYEYDYYNSRKKNRASIYVWETNSSLPIYDSNNIKKINNQWLSYGKDFSRKSCSSCVRNDFASSFIFNKSSYISQYTLDVFGILTIKFDKINISNIANDMKILEKIDFKKNEIDTSKIIELDEHAELTFKDVNYSFPLMLYNDAKCPESICTWIYANRVNKTVTVNISKYGKFKLVEENCDYDDICDINENSNNCINDCKPLAPTNENALCIYNSNSSRSLEICNYYIYKRKGALMLGVEISNSSFLDNNLETMDEYNFTKYVHDPLFNWLSKNPNNVTHIAIAKDIPIVVSSGGARITSANYISYKDVMHKLNIFNLFSSFYYQIYNSYYMSYDHIISQEDKSAFLAASYLNGYEVKDIKKMIDKSAGELNVYDPIWLFDGDRDQFSISKSYFDKMNGKLIKRNIPSNAIVYDFEQGNKLNLQKQIIALVSAGVYHSNYSSSWMNNKSLFDISVSNGAIISTIESFNGATFYGDANHSINTPWSFQSKIADAISENAFGGENYSNSFSGAAGFVEEPYLTGAEDMISYFMEGYASGLTLGESYMRSSPGQRSVFIVIGDPLMRIKLDYPQDNSKIYAPESRGGGGGGGGGLPVKSVSTNNSIINMSKGENYTEPDNPLINKSSQEENPMKTGGYMIILSIIIILIFALLILLIIIIKREKKEDARSEQISLALR